MGLFRSLGILACMVCVEACSPARYHLVTLGDSLEPVRTQFNADRGRPRVVALFSPT